MINHYKIEQLARRLRRQEISRLSREFTMWLGTLLRTRHETELRRPDCRAAPLPVNPTPA